MLVLSVRKASRFTSPELSKPRRLTYFGNSSDVGSSVYVKRLALRSLMMTQAILNRFMEEKLFGLEILRSRCDKVRQLND
jgi:hypothetical protein